MNGLENAIMNPMLVIPIVAWFIAQISKTILHACINRKVVFERMVGGGGMPSAHSATVCSFCTTCFFIYGPSSFEFAMSVVFALVTMYDAMGVRRETGRQGEVLNDLIEMFKLMGKDVGPDKALKELIGHSPLQVAVGALLGILVATVMFNVGIF